MIKAYFAREKDSDYCADWTDYADSCEDWEGKDDERYGLQ